MPTWHSGLLSSVCSAGGHYVIDVQGEQAIVRWTEEAVQVRAGSNTLLLVKEGTGSSAMIDTHI